jgi:hypothetical protein
VGKVTIYRWLRDGFITGEQLTRGALWRIRIDQAGQERIVAVVPDGWIGLAEPANVLGVPKRHRRHLDHHRPADNARPTNQGIQRTRWPVLTNPREEAPEC